MISTQEMLLRLMLAAIFGAIIGWERERRAWTAGLRTHMLVCLGSALAMLVSSFGFKDVIGHAGYVLDPSRVAAQVISGIGFLGAGTILFLRSEIVKGLTTAAGLWTVAAIGLAAGGGLYIEAGAATLIAFLILIALKPVEDRFLAKNKFKSIIIEFKSKTVNLLEIENILKSHRLNYLEIHLNLDREDDVEEMRIRIQKDFSRTANALTVIEEIRGIEGILNVNFSS